MASVIRRIITLYPNRLESHINYLLTIYTVYPVYSSLGSFNHL